MEEELSEGNNTGLDHLEKRDSLYIVIPITILYSVIFLTGFIGNVVTCIVIARNKHMHTATNYYLFSLAVSDLLLLVTGLPQEMYSIWSRYPYIFGEAFCILRGLAAETSANATVLTIAAFTVERYLAICHPFLAHTMSKLSRAIKFIITIWIIALAFAIPQAAQFGVIESPDAEHTACHVKRKIFDYSFEVSTFLFFFIPMTLITILYILIGLRLRRSALLKKSSGSFGNHQEASRKGSCRQQSSSRVLKMLVAVVVAFFICWAPFHAQRLIAIYVLPDDTPSPFTIKLYFIATYVSGILYYVSTTVNPILYQIMSLKFREAFKDSLSRCCCQKGRRRSYSMLSRQQKTMGQTGKKGTGPESVTDSGASGSGTGSSYRHDLHKNRHISESSYVLNESCNKTIIPMEIVVGQDRSKVYVIKRNCPHEVEVDEEKKSDSLCWISCITSPTDKTKSIKVTWKIDEKNLSPGPNRRLSGSSNNISNSSLKDVDRHELQDELSQYIFSTAKRNL